MFRIMRVAAAIGALAYLSPERDRQAALPLPSANPEAILRALPDGVRDRMAAEALRRALEQAGRNPSGPEAGRPSPAPR